MTQINYESDWAGECRVDPDDGNAYVLRSVGRETYRDVTFTGVVVNDIFGGHRRVVLLTKWLEWEVSDLRPGDLERAGEIIRDYDEEPRS